MIATSSSSPVRLGLEDFLSLFQNCAHSLAFPNFGPSSHVIKELIQAFQMRFRFFEMLGEIFAQSQAGHSLNAIEAMP